MQLDDSTSFWNLNFAQHVCRTGRSDFKKDMAKHVDVIKECLRKHENKIHSNIITGK
jgi:hypothetical protein